ncbi:winged helix-turn-helix domain-containing protein [Desulfobacter sp.]|uniref:winged helix-turn-helix domain-containing protein n=1 Tax=Desulfobacter sp. TaxID=2294 RepID=UPI003D0CF38A
MLAVQKRSGRSNKLAGTQKKQLKQWLTDGPQSVGFPGACWSTPMIQELIYQKFGVLYSVKYLSEFLKNLGFSYQKARFAVGGKNPENTLKRKIWIEQTLPDIVAQAQKQKTYLLFGDDVSASTITQEMNFSSLFHRSPTQSPKFVIISRFHMDCSYPASALMFPTP